MAELLIYKKKIISNLEKIKTYSNENIYVLKANAYGFGIENIAKILKDEKFFAVSNIEEALRLRKVNKYCRILILGDIDQDKLYLLKKYNLEPTAFCKDHLEKYKGLSVHLAFNTGLNRLGFDRPVYYPKIESIYSHISDAFNLKRTEEQIEKFDKICKFYKNIKQHLFSTEALLNYKNKNKYDYCRIGMGLYGFNEGFLKAGILKVKVLQKRTVKKGDYIFYGSKNIAKKDMDIAILELGYKDINIKNACMDMMYVPITKDIGKYVYIDIKSEKQLASLSTYIPRIIIGS